MQAPLLCAAPPSPRHMHHVKTRCFPALPQVRGLTKVEVGSEEEALMQYFAGDQGRSTAGHVLNAQSSRSHCVFSLHVEMRTSEAASERAVLSKLHMVDLAGSGERCGFKWK